MKSRIAVVAMVIASGLASCHSVAPASDTPASGMELFLLAGQSNMAGRGVVEAEDRVPHAGVMKLDRALAWVPATDPVHFDKSVAGVGPGRMFGIVVAEKNPRATIGLVPTAVGGSPISSWEPGALDAATKTHPYDDALVQIRAARKDGTFRAILWHQGESDATPALSLLYEGRLRALIARLRTELDDPNLPFIIGELGQFNQWNAAKMRVDSAQRAVAAAMPHVAYVSSDGLHDKGDTLHFDARSARELGRRYAAAYLEVIRK